MSSLALLDKTRKIGRLLHNNASSKVVFSDICDVMQEVLASDVFVVSKRGKVLGCGEAEGVQRIAELLAYEEGALIDSALNERFLSILSTQDNVNLMTLGFSTDAAQTGARIHAVASPILIAGERLGTLFLYKDRGWYDMDDIILVEYAATVVGLELMRSLTEEADEKGRRAAVVHAALDAMTVSERQAAAAIRKLLKPDPDQPAAEGEILIVTSHIAEEIRIARSVVVNALRKLEGAGIIETRSAGVKGTRVKVVNDVLFTVELK
ncbi:MAG: GTP-sensing pleiotropic transcriptional regulator CodY [Lachnospiraceae bacterium]|nr:GTP-sensing pleiotropic transcriptional regulator CodY [Lachnospiraceae bacterium]